MKYKNFTNGIVFKKYRVKKILAFTKFSHVYEGINIIKKTPVALKIEKDNHLKFLESEAYLLIYLKGFGIPKIIGYGKSGNYNILIEELLGPNMEALWKKYGYKEDQFVKNNKIIKDVCLIAIQSLERLKYIHNKNVIHRDLKSTNFIIGRKDPNIIYLIDFGFSRKFRSSRTGKHIKYEYKHILMGSLTFASCNAMRGYEQSRRDDLESLGYVLIYLAKGLWLPWRKYDNSSLLQKESIKIITKMKMEISEENLCKGLPNEFISYMKYVKHLEFEEDPDYKYLNSLFLSILSRNEFWNNLDFFWIPKPKTKSFPKLRNSEKENEKEDFNNTFKKLNSTQIRGSSQKRLYKSIKNSLDKRNRLKNPNTNILGNKSVQVQSNYTSLGNEINLDLKINLKLDYDLRIKKRSQICVIKNDSEFNIPKKNLFKEEYSKIKKTNLRYVPKVFNINKKNLINHSVNFKPNKKVFNRIKNKNSFLLNDNISIKNSCLFNDCKKGIINYKTSITSINKYKTYRSIIKTKI